MWLARLNPLGLRVAVRRSTILLCVSVVSTLAQDKPAQTTPSVAIPSVPAASTNRKPETSASAEQKPTVLKEDDKGVQLGVGDLVEVTVYNVPELTSKARISNSGDVYLPLIDYAHVAGLSTEEAQELIEKKLADGGFVKNPHVTIFVDEYASQGVSVLGEVVKPGVYPVVGKQRLFDLISASGGLTDRAGGSATVTHRGEPDKATTVALAKNLNDIPQSNVEIAGGDTIVIRRADIVYVVGDVARPSGLLIDRGSLTVLQAIALAGGTTRTSRLNGTRIIHKGPDGISEKHVELKKILQAKLADVPLNADDILFVPSSTIKLALQDNVSIAMQAASLGLVALH